MVFSRNEKLYGNEIIRNTRIAITAHDGDGMNCPIKTESNTYTMTIATENGIYHLVMFRHEGMIKTIAKITCNGVNHNALQFGNTNE